MDRTAEPAAPKPKNREIFVVTYAFVAVFLCLMGYVCYFAVTNKQELMNNSYNTRQNLLAKQNTRGTIYAASGEVLARSVPTPDGSETREYPYDNLFAHVVGYATNGKAGIESMANYYLINSNEPLSEKVNHDKDGTKYKADSIYTTLDVDLQQVAANAMGIYKGAIVVTEVSTGKVLAMVSKPDFDPNEIAQIWDTVVEDKESGILLNRVTQGMYPPGSTFKIITALAYIRENPETYADYQYNCTGSFSIGKDKISCYHGTSHGKEDFQKSFAKSCNASFANIGVNLNKTNFADTLQTLLFNQELPLKLSYNKSRITVDENSTPADMMQIAIGQGTTSMSPMHLNMITSAVANNGNLMKPYIVEKVENYQGDSIKQFTPASFGKIMTETEAGILKKLMEEVVQSGTGTKLKGLSYTAAGKTGSAEYSNVKGESHAWFTGYAPAENPAICVTIIIEGAGSGGDYAVPIAKRIFDAYFEQ